VAVPKVYLKHTPSHLFATPDAVYDITMISYQQPIQPFPFLPCPDLRLLSSVLICLGLERHSEKDL